MQYASEEVGRLHNVLLGPEHLMLGILRLQEGKAFELLCRSGVMFTELKQNLEENLQLRTLTPNPPIHPDFTDTTSLILRMAMLEREAYQADACGSVHILLAMLHERANYPAMLLNRDYNINYNSIERLYPHPAERLDSAVEKPRPDEEEEKEFAKEAERMANSLFSHIAGAGFLLLNSRPGRKSDMPTPDVPEDNGNNEPPKEPESDTPALDYFSRDLTQMAREGLLDPVIGRRAEINRLEQILARRKKNNPILIGDAGVGKTAIVEGLALKWVKSKSKHLNKLRVVALDMASIVAGTTYRGQFEERLRRLIAELRQHPEIILAIDEIHTIVGAGSAPGTLDAANILKPALARGEIRCVGTTTTAEYRKSIEKDGALDRRFQQVRVEPTTPDETLLILQNLRERYESHHGVTYTPEALQACVALTERYVNTRHFPDKAIDALDEAGAQAHAVSAEVSPRMKELIAEAAALREKIKEAVRQEDYGSAVGLRESLVEVQREVDAASDAWRKETESTQKQVVTADDVARVVSMMSRVPVQRMQQDERQMLRHLAERLGEKVIAQDEAIAQLSRAIQRSRLGLKDPGRPIGVFMFVGPTGVGKTHLAKSLAVEMFGSPDALIRIDMSEFGEKHTGARLVGAPPGYVGYDEGGQLTEKVRRRPYSIILLDEIEKAHPDVFNMLLQVMDEGRLTDGNGVTVDFRHTVIIMTSNSGSRQIRDFGAGVGFSAPAEADAALIASTTRKALERQFAPEFLNRLDDIIMFHPLSRDAAARIVRIEVDALLSRLREGGTQVIVDEAVYGHIAQTGYESRYGARSLKRTIQEKIETPLCAALMEEAPSTSPEGDSPIHITVEDNKIKIY